MWKWQSLTLIFAKVTAPVSLTHHSPVFLVTPASCLQGYAAPSPPVTDWSIQGNLHFSPLHLLTSPSLIYQLLRLPDAADFTTQLPFSSWPFGWETSPGMLMVQLPWGHHGRLHLGMIPECLPRGPDSSLHHVWGNLYRPSSLLSSLAQEQPSPAQSEEKPPPRPADLHSQGHGGSLGLGVRWFLLLPSLL